MPKEQSEVRKIKTPTFYLIISDDSTIGQLRFEDGEYEKAITKLAALARVHQGTKFHLMRRLSSVVASDLTWEDSDWS